MRINVAYIISHIDKALAFEWIAKYIDPTKINLCFILLNEDDSELERYLRSVEISVYRVYYKDKTNFFSAFFQVRRILKEKTVDVVHAHLFDASLIGLLAAFSVGVKKRIHTRHNSTIHHVYFPRAVKYDRFINLLSTDIIAISDVVRKVLVEMEGANPNKISIIHHGFGFDEIPVDGSERIIAIKEKYNSGDKRPVIGVISRYIHWKGIQHIIPAFSKLLELYPDALLILANAAGPYQNEIKHLLSSLPESAFIEIKFEKDIFSLYKLFDIFIHVPIDEFSEAFGQTYVEALSVGIPSVVTLSGIAHELIENRKNAIVVDHQNSDDIYRAIAELIEDPSLKKKLIEQGQHDVRERFDLSQMIDKLEQLYFK